MKNLLSITFALAVLCSGRLSAQIAVVDGAQIQQSWLEHLEELARFKAMIDNQVLQITALSQQLAQITFVSTVLGNPATNQALPGISAVVTSINAAGAALSRVELLAESTASIAHFDNGRGLYRVIGDSFQSPDGRTISRQTDAYKPMAAVIQTTTNHDAVYEDVLIRRRALREGLRDTLQQLRSATTDAESQKLQGVLIGQMAELAATDHEADFAAQRAVIQDIANRNDRLRQQEARREEQTQEMADTMNRLAGFLRPNTKPTKLNNPR